MKKIIHGLLAAVLVSSNVYATVSNQTYMRSRDALSNNAVIGMTVGAKKGKSCGMGADVSVAGFYRLSHNEGDLAKYFGAGQAADSDQNGTILVGTAATDDVHGQYVMYNSAAANAVKGTVNFSPRREEYGAHVAWNQDLGKWVKGLSLSVDAPITHVSHDLRATYTATTADADTNKNLSDFFTGGANGATTPTQDALTHAKISATKLSETGVADVSAKLGYQVVTEKDYNVNVGLNFRIPTGNKIKGVNLFEANYGSRQFGLGASLSSDFNLWRSENGKSGLDLNLGVNYEYQFAARETRTMGLYDHANAKTVSAGHYTNAFAAGAASLVSVANVTTLEHDVEPGSRLDGVAGFTYNCGRLNVGAHYNVFYAQEENLTLKGTWTNDTYGRPAAALTAVPGALTNNIQVKGDTTGATYVSSAAATTPAQVTHKVAGSVGYCFDMKTPVRIGAGASGEFSSNNASVNSWDVWAKVGICF